ncbi:MAG TPA: MFS transporter [Gaiellaceae bacterium]|nr:MFS transporter [Gaiellaceae bacterium]
MYGTLGAAWPLLRDDLGLTYAEIGLALAVPGFVGSALDPLIGVLGDTGRRRLVMVLGGVAFAGSAALLSASVGFWMLVVALVVGNPASGAFVSLAQATLMDLAPSERERNMARWTIAGSFGYVAGPLLLAAALSVGAGWRAAVAALAVAAVPLVVATRRLPGAPSAADTSGAWHHAFAALRRREVLRWLVLLEAADLLLDIFYGYLALYFVDVARTAPASAALGVAVWTGAGLVGDWLLLFVLRRVPGRRYLRASAVVTLAVYPAFLLVPTFELKLALVAGLGLLNAGWYAIPKAGLYDALPGRSGAAVAVGGDAGLAGAAVPLVLGLVAGAVGLGPTMWVLTVAPVALLAFLPRR